MCFHKSKAGTRIIYRTLQEACKMDVKMATQPFRVTLGEGKESRLVVNAMVTATTGARGGGNSNVTSHGSLNTLVAFRTAAASESQPPPHVAKQQAARHPKLRGGGGGGGCEGGGGEGGGGGAGVGDMLITAKEQSIASKSQLKGHAHHYFLSPYRNLQRPHAGVGGGGENCPTTTAGIEPDGGPIAAEGYHDATERDADNITSLSHPDLPSTLLALRVEYMTSPTVGNETSRSLPTEPNPLPARDKLPPIVNFRKQYGRTQKDNNRWLGPPNSIPPNKRSEHIAAYKIQAVAKPHRITPLHDNQNPTDTGQGTAQSIGKGKLQLYHEFRPAELGQQFGDAGAGEGGDDDGESSGSLYPDSDTYSIASETQYTQLHFRDKPLAKHMSSSGPSLRLRSHTHRSSTRYDADSSEHYSTAAMLNGYGENMSDSMSTYSSHSIKQRRKRVHFDPTVREVSRENRSAPLATNYSLSYYGESSNAPTRFQVDINPSSGDSTVDQLPAVVEKYMIKNLPVLPNIQGSKPVNANIIYIKNDGKPSGSGGAQAMSRPVLIARNNVISVSSSATVGVVSSTAGGSSVTSQSGSGGTATSSTSRVHHRLAGAAMAPQLARLTEESSVGSSSPSPQLKHSSSNKFGNHSSSPPAASTQHSSVTSKKATAAATHPSTVTATTMLNTTTNTSHSSTSNTSHLQQAALAHAAQSQAASTPRGAGANTTSTKKTTSKKNKTLDTSKKTGGAAKNGEGGTGGGGSVKTKGSKGRSKGRSSGSSSRNSASGTGNGLDTPPEHPEVDEEELREQRLREYAAAMLKVQQRMREFDLRYGKKTQQHSEYPQDEPLDMFGKVIPAGKPSNAGTTKTRPSKPK